MNSYSSTMACACLCRRLSTPQLLGHLGQLRLQTSNLNHRSLVCHFLRICTTRHYRSPTMTSEQACTHVVDMRSDTVTKPTAAMRQAMAEAEVGDDVFGEDPTINAFQQQMAKMFGMEAALFVPTGTMGNCMSVLAHCDTRGLEVILGDKSHIFRYEQGGIAQVILGDASHIWRKELPLISQSGGIHSYSVPNQADGTIALADVKAAIRPTDDPHQPITKVICIENTQNFCGGKVLPMEYIKQMRTLADEHNLKLHLDGARVMNAAVKLDLPLSDLLQCVDSVSLCFSKGLGAPVGSVVGGSKEFIAKCIRLRKMLGGGMRQAGVLAAACQVALTDAKERLERDHEHARKLAEALCLHGEGVLHVNLDGVHTNIIMAEITKTGITAEDISDRLAKVTHHEITSSDKRIAVRSVAFASNLIRFVTHSDLSSSDIDLAIEKMKHVLKEFRG